MRKHTFFLIRYSVFNKSQGLWAIGSNVDAESYKEKLFTEDRLALHEELFLKTALPSLEILSKEGRMTALVFVSPEMPEKYLHKIRSVAATRNWMKVISVRSDKALNRQIEGRIKKELDGFEEDVCYATVRLDDDDALASDYCMILEKYMFPEHAGYCVSFPEGLLSVFDNGVYVSHYYHRQINNAQGLAMINTSSRVDADATPLTVFGTGNHNTVDKRYPVILDSKDVMYLRTEHPHSDLVANSGRHRDKQKMVEVAATEWLAINSRFPFL